MPAEPREPHLIQQTDIIISWDDDDPADIDVVMLDVIDSDEPAS